MKALIGSLRSALPNIDFRLIIYGTANFFLISQEGTLAKYLLRSFVNFARSRSKSMGVSKESARKKNTIAPTSPISLSRLEISLFFCT